MMLLALLLSGTVVADSSPCARVALGDGRIAWVFGLPQGVETGDIVHLHGEWRDLRSCQVRGFAVSEIIEPPIPADGIDGD